MRELELDGIHDDGDHVILLDSDGERYTLRIDEALRAAVRRDRPALGMIQASESAPLRPREIQALLRAGRSAEDIAEVAHVTVERVRRYEGPVLAEREWTADRARRFPLGRGGPGLDQVVAERLAARQATEDTAWDAWRRNDGSWTLELTFSAGGRTRQAHWQADLDNRSVVPLDDEARWISDEDGPPEPSRGRARLMAVKSSVYDLEADGAFDENAPRPARGRGPATPFSTTVGRASGDHPSALDEQELDALNARRGLRSVPPLTADREDPTVWSSLADDSSSTDAPHSESDVPGDAAAGPNSSHGSAEAPAAAEATDEARQENWATRAGISHPGATDGAADADREAELEHSGESADHDHEDSIAPDPIERTHETDLSVSPGQNDEESGHDEAGAADAAGSEPAPEEIQVHYQDTVDLTPLPGFADVPSPSDGDEDTQKKRPAKKPAKNKRASIPSWDEIVFGSKHD